MRKNPAFNFIFMLPVVFRHEEMSVVRNGITDTMQEIKQAKSASL